MCVCVCTCVLFVGLKHVCFLLHTDYFIYALYVINWTNITDLEFSRIESWSRDVTRPSFQSLGLGPVKAWSLSWCWSFISRTTVQVALLLKTASHTLYGKACVAASRQQMNVGSLLIDELNLVTKPRLCQIHTLGLKWHAATCTNCCINRQTVFHRYNGGLHFVPLCVVCWWLQMNAQ